MKVSTNRPLVSAALFGCLCFSTFAVAAEKSAPFMTALESISASELQQHVEYLASDKLKGREAGKAGGRKAGQYLAMAFKKLNLKPAGDGKTFFQGFDNRYRNVVAMLEGSDPKLKNQVVVIGSHYDHVGYGNSRNSRGPTGRIHNGADDNASGTAALIELAEAFTLLPEAPKRSVLFIGFDAEEKGLLGSQHWCRKPTVPLDRLVAMLNMDMLGRLRDDTLYVYGTRSGFGLRRFLCEQNEDLRLDCSWTMKAKADHYPFFKRDMPVLLFNTGLHDVYHTPGDDAELINEKGMRRTSRLVFRTAYELVEQDEIPQFREKAASENNWKRYRDCLPASFPPGRLGIRWDTNAKPGPGLRLAAIYAGSAAEKSDLKAGDRIITFDGNEIETGDDLCGAVLAAENPVEVVVNRPGEDEPLTLTVELTGKPLRVGINWRVDSAEPNTIILTRVMRGSPAARAGLKFGDRIYTVAGGKFADEKEFIEMINRPADEIPLEVEREGRVIEIILRFVEQSKREV